MKSRISISSWRVVFPALLGSMVVPVAGQNVRYVGGPAAGTGNGQTWADAYADLQAALAEAAGGGVQEIWVAAGTYAPAGPAGDRSASFHLISGVGVYGGFAGTETQRDQRQPRIHPTVLTGDLNGDDSTGGSGATSDNSYHVVTGSGTDNRAVLDGFLITAGRATASAIPDNVGAGLFNLAGGPTIVDCEFRDNMADFAGGAVYNEESAARFVHCVFAENRANNRGGAIYDTFSSQTLVNRCLFAGNHADSGGAVHSSGCGPVVANSVFSGNSALAGGALFNNGGAMLLVNCTLGANEATYTGGGLYTAAGEPLVRNCVFWGNHDAAGMDESAQIARAGGVPDVRYACVQGGWTGEGGISILVSDPMFVDPAGPDGTVGTADDDLRLQSKSTSINAGDNTAVPAGLDSDLPGRPRIAETRVDLGAYEFVPDSGGDLDGDGDVDRDDLAVFESCGTGPELGPPAPAACLAADLDADGDVDQTDFGILQRMLQHP